MNGKPANTPTAPGLVCARCHRPLRIPTRKKVGPPPDPRGRVWVAIRHWPEGWICSGCFARACETYGVCEGCDTHRLLPGIAPNGQPWCADCTGGIGDFTCTRCGQEGWHHYKGVCGRCVLADRLTVTLDDGTGRVRPELTRLFDRLVAMSRPRSGILWLTKPHVPPILHAIAHSQVPLTHEGLATLAPLQSVIGVRDLLVSAGILPPVDRYLFLFEQWLPGRLEQIADPEQRKIVHRYATWHILRRLREAAVQGPIGHYRGQSARHRVRVAADFLDYLTSANTGLDTCRQGDLDRWFATTIDSTRSASRDFIGWAMSSRHMPRLQQPRTHEHAPAPISLRRRLELLRRIHTGHDMDPIERVVGLLILLYAQPLSRITRLTTDDVSFDEQDRMLIRLGNPPVPVPAPFDQIIADHLAARPHLTTAANPHSNWLFPGRRAGQPMHPTSIRARLRALGIPNLNGRSRALREMLLQAPPSVVAGMLGYASGRAETIAIEAGATYQRYAAGDHHRTRTPRLNR